MLEFLAQQNLWDTLRLRARSGKGRNLVAVPYVGAGAAKLLRLGLGDVLICALTESNCKNGSVNPFELDTLRKRGVRIYICRDLHAKIYLLGSHVIIGSANFSKNSLKELDEAGLHTTDSAVVRAVGAWFKERMSEPVTPEWLTHCKSVYRPPMGTKGRGASKNSTAAPPAGRVWIVGTHALETFPKSEQSALASGLQIAKQRLRHHKHYEVETLRWSGEDRFSNSIKREDILVEVHENAVYPHQRVLNTKRTQSKMGRSVTYVYCEAVKQPETMAWSRFRSECRKIGVRLGVRAGAREIRDTRTQRRILGLVSPEVP